MGGGDFLSFGENILNFLGEKFCVNFCGKKIGENFFLHSKS
jgi:hypothetical protein